MTLLVRPAGIADRGALLSLFAVAFRAQPDPAEWVWKYDRNPCPAVSVVALEGDEVVGHYGAFGTRYRGAEGSHPAASGGDLMTRPSARSLGRVNVFKQLGEAFHALNGAYGVPFGFGFPHERARKIEERLLGYRVVERPGLLARELLPPRRLARLRRRLRRVVEGEPFGAAHAPLAEALHAAPGWRTERSAEFLNWRLSRPGAAYHVLQHLDRAGRSRGYAVIRAVEGRALLVDLQLLHEGEGTLPDLLEDASTFASRAGCQRLEVRLPAKGRLAERLRGELGFCDEVPDTVLFVHPFRGDFDLEKAAPLFDYRYLDHDIF